MDSTHYFRIIPLLFTFISLILYTVSSFLFNHKHKKILIKSLLSYIVVSLLFIVVFSFLYSMIYLFDMGQLPKDSNYKLNIENWKKELEKGTMTQTQFNDKISNYMSFNNLNYFKHFSAKGINKLKYISLDIFYFSSMTFFTIGYGDITLNGFARIFPIIQSAFGVGFTAVFISLLVIKYSTAIDENTIEIIKSKINSGFKVLNINKSDVKCIKVILISPDWSFNEAYSLYKDSSVIKFLEAFKISEWKFKNNSNLIYYNKFKLYLKRVSEEYRDYKFYLNIKKINDISSEKELKQFYLFLENLNYSELNEDFYYICFGSIIDCKEALAKRFKY